MSYIHANIARPTEGEGIDRLDNDKFAANIAAKLRAELGDDVRIRVVVFDHDGTGRDEWAMSDDLADFDPSDAVADAFADESSYDDEVQG